MLYQKIRYILKDREVKDMWMEKLKGIFAKNEQNPKRRTENLIVFLIILVVTVICINLIWKKDEKKDEISKDNNVKLAVSEHKEGEESINLQQNDLEKRLEEILKKMNGIEDVKVLITYSETSAITPLYNEKQTETISQDGKQTETDTAKEVVFEESGSSKTPVLQSTKLPKLEGAVIMAKGAESVEVKANIIQAVEAATGLSSHKIQVFEMK